MLSAWLRMRRSPTTYDVDGDGNVTMGELLQVSRIIGRTPQVSDAEAILSCVARAPTTGQSTAGSPQPTRPGTDMDAAIAGSNEDAASDLVFDAEFSVRGHHELSGAYHVEIHAGTMANLVFVDDDGRTYRGKLYAVQQGGRITYLEVTANPYRLWRDDDGHWHLDVLLDKGTVRLGVLQ
jgi:hypothetical protein